MKLITENTAIPISLLLVILGGAAWLTSIYFTGQANSAQIQELKSDQSQEFLRLNQSLEDIRERLSRIEGRLDIKHKE